MLYPFHKEEVEGSRETFQALTKTELDPKFGSNLTPNPSCQCLEILSQKKKKNSTLSSQGVWRQQLLHLQQKDLLPPMGNVIHF